MPSEHDPTWGCQPIISPPHKPPESKSFKRELSSDVLAGLLAFVLDTIGLHLTLCVLVHKH